MLAAFLGATLLLFLAVSMKERWGHLVSDWRRPVLTFFPVIALIGAYYAWTLIRGAGSDRSESGLKNIAFVIYEFCGFAGLGPPRNDLRATGGTGLLAYWPMLVLGCAALLSILAVIIIAPHRKLDRDFALSVAVGLVIAILACKAAHFRFLGRHLTAFYPFILIALLMNTQVLDKLRRRWTVVGAFTLLAVAWAVSDARMLLPIYGKEDYRGAAAVALERAKPSGKTILWAANGVAAYYYGLKGDERFYRNLFGKPLTSEPIDWPVSERVLLASNWTSAEVCSYAKGSAGSFILVLGSRPDAYDQNGAWAWLIRQPEAHAIRIATRTSFEIYELSPDK
jgi:branched-subunit amino acid transport protein AzlD